MVGLRPGDGPGLQRQQRTRLRAERIQMVFVDERTAQGGRGADDVSGGVAGGKAVIIQEPDAHVTLAGFLHDDIHISPPARAVKIGMRAGLQAHGADAGGVDAGYFLAQHGFGLAVHPEEGQDVILLSMLEHIVEWSGHGYPVAMR